MASFQEIYIVAVVEPGWSIALEEKKVYGGAGVSFFVNFKLTYISPPDFGGAWFDTLTFVF